MNFIARFYMDFPMAFVARTEKNHLITFVAAYKDNPMSFVARSYMDHQMVFVSRIIRNTQWLL